MNFELPETLDNSLYTSENLQSIVITSDKFGSLSVFPQQNQMIGGSFNVSIYFDQRIDIFSCCFW